MQCTDICSSISKWDYNDKIISDLKSEGRFRLKAQCVSSLFRVWKALTSNYGHVMPVDWKQSRSCSLHIPTFNLEEKRVSGATIQSLSHFPFEPPDPPKKISHVSSSHKSQIFIVPGFRALINFPPPGLLLTRRRLMSARRSCQMTRSWGSSWTCTPSSSPASPRNRFSQQSR